MGGDPVNYSDAFGLCCFNIAVHAATAPKVVDRMALQVLIVNWPQIDEAWKGGVRDVETIMTVAGALEGFATSLARAPSSTRFPAGDFGSTPAGRPLTEHYATQTGPGRNIPGSVVDETIAQSPGRAVNGGKTVHYDPGNNVTVVTGDGESIVSARKGPPRANQAPKAPDED